MLSRYRVCYQNLKKIVHQALEISLHHISLIRLLKSQSMASKATVIPPPDPVKEVNTASSTSETEVEQAGRHILCQMRIILSYQHLASEKVSAPTHQVRNGEEGLLA